MKVGFVIGGTQKGGTTALDAYLRQHPEVCMAQQKEVHFFLGDHHCGPEAHDYSGYHRWFDPRPGHRVIGEATPAYMYWYGAPRRIWEYNPAMKWLLLLRNPIERAYSHWQMAIDQGWDDLDFWNAILQEQIRCREFLPLQNKRISYVDRGFYTEQLRRVWFFFPRSQTLVLKSEGLRTAPTAVLKTVCDFLGVAPFDQIEPLTLNAQDYASPMGARERRYLARVFEHEVKELERLLGWDCGAWLE